MKIFCTYLFASLHLFSVITWYKPRQGSTILHFLAWIKWKARQTSTKFFIVHFCTLSNLVVHSKIQLWNFQNNKICFQMTARKSFQMTACKCIYISTFFSHPPDGTRHSLLVRKVWGSNSEPIKSPTLCQRLATVATLMCGPWRKAAEMGPLTRDTRKGIKRV